MCRPSRSPSQKVAPAPWKCSVTPRPGSGHPLSLTQTTCPGPQPLRPGWAEHLPAALLTCLPRIALAWAFLSELSELTASSATAGPGSRPGPSCAGSAGEGQAWAGASGPARQWRAEPAQEHSGSHALSTVVTTTASQGRPPGPEGCHLPF